MSAFEVTGLVLGVIYQPFSLIRLYGASGIVYYVFGSRTTWRTQAHVLGALKDEDAQNFKKSVQEECAMISVAAAIVAQIAITGLGFAELSKTHWVARALFLYSVLSSLMAVYYATTQQRVMGRLHRPEQIRGWIRGRLPLSQEQQRPLRHRRGGGGVRMQGDPQHYESTTLDPVQLAWELAQKCFCPSVTSVLTVSAPQVLLSSSLLALLLGVGVYFGFVWTRGLDGDAGKGDSRNVMIVYLVSIVVCFVVYSVSQFLQDDERRQEAEIVREYVADFLARRNDPALLPTQDLQHHIRQDLFSIQALLRDIRGLSQAAATQRNNQAINGGEPTARVT
ncbi:hypothetical protein PWT90_07583 [Aphanocladium album]|nr:hypothetical protein PWT90_07583 [Aphanocladium album]